MFLLFASVNFMSALLIFAFFLSLSYASLDSIDLSFFQSQIQERILADSFPLLFTQRNGERNTREILGRGCLGNKGILECMSCSIVGEYAIKLREQTFSSNLTAGGQYTVLTTANATFTEREQKWKKGVKEILGIRKRACVVQFLINIFFPLRQFPYAHHLLQSILQSADVHFL